MVKMDIELTMIKDHVLKMANNVINMHEQVVDVLKEQNRDKELDIMEADDLINHLDEKINHEAMRALALLSPVAGDLRFLVANIKIASELERIGDYAKNSSKYLLHDNTLEQKISEYAIKMEEYFIHMLTMLMKGYDECDVDTAFEIAKQYHRREYEQRLKNEILLTYEDTMEQVFELSRIMRNIERSFDHTINICEHIIFMIQGQHYEFG